MEREREREREKRECHEPRRRWFLFLFGRPSVGVVAGLLAATDPLFCFI
jgi:hypothetical protein